MNKKELLKSLRKELKALKDEVSLILEKGRGENLSFVRGLISGLEISIHQIKRLI